MEDRGDPIGNRESARVNTRWQERIKTTPSPSSMKRLACFSEPSDIPPLRLSKHATLRISSAATNTVH